MPDFEEQSDTIEALDDIIDDIGDLPTLPTVVTKITQMTSNPQTNAADVGKLIGNDPSLSSKILKLVNSAYYGFPRSINSVTKAIVLLGFNKVKNIALSASVVEAFKKTSKTSKFDFYQFWEHSVATGVAAEVVAKTLRPQVVDDAFVGGLLHDIGKVIVSTHVDDAPRIFEYAQASRTTFARACMEIVQYDQAKVGSLLAEHWSFPELLVNSIRYWPYPDRLRQNRDTILCVHLGNVLVSALGITAPGDYAMPLLTPSVWEEFKLEESVLETLLAETLTGFSNAAAFVELAN